MRISRKSQLSDVLGEFARTMMTEFPIQAILDRLVARIVDVLPVTGAGVTLISDGVVPRYIAASNPKALHSERLQSELDEGPCLVAFRSGQAVTVPDLAGDHRFPLFGPRAAAAGLAAVFTFPLGHSGALIGALDLYRDTPGPLDAEDMHAAQTLADVAAAYLLNARARADLSAAAELFRHNSLHDMLTGLPNRMLFLERLEHAVLRARRSHQLIAVLYADLDRFKMVNDLHGHDAGDDLLVAVTERLAAALRPGDTLARLAGDEFVVLCEGLVDGSEASRIVDRLTRAMLRPFTLSGVEMHVTASIGVTFAGAGQDVVAEEILRNADAAMYEAKRSGGGRHVILETTEQSRPSEEATLSYDLGHAVRGDELRLDYQPIATTTDGTVVGIEALARWQHPHRGLVAPGVFIPIAERAALIGGIGQWVLRRACTDLARWRAPSPGSRLVLSVNVSARQLMDPDFARTVTTVLAETSTSPDSLILEVTETVFIRDGDRALAAMNALKELGVALALDDFGTGFSSLSHLNRFPVDIIKIDRTFVSALGIETASTAIVTAVIDLGHTLGMTVTAEGVETAGQHQRLIELGADTCQGYHFARPMPASDLDALLGTSA